MSVVLLATNNCSSSCKGLSKAKGKRKLPAVAEESDGESENEEMDERESGSERDDDADDSDDDRPLGQKQSVSENWVEFDKLPTLPIVAVWDDKKRKVNFAGFTHQDKDGQQCGVWFGPTTSTSRKALELRKFCRPQACGSVQLAAKTKPRAHVGNVVQGRRAPQRREVPLCRQKDK